MKTSLLLIKPAPHYRTVTSSKRVAHIDRECAKPRGYFNVIGGQLPPGAARRVAAL